MPAATVPGSNALVATIRSNGIILMVYLTVNVARQVQDTPSTWVVTTLHQQSTEPAGSPAR